MALEALEVSVLAIVGDARKRQIWNLEKLAAAPEKSLKSLENFCGWFLCIDTAAGQL